MPSWLAGGNLAVYFVRVNCADVLLHGRLVEI